ncbi:MAG: SpvB/TcaC N-terminal domain-containing protein, partial [Patescibacteria group bacterium]
MLHKRIFTIFFLFTFIFQGTFIIFKPALGAEEIPAEPAAGESEAGASDNNLPPDNNTTENNEIIGLGNENPDGESSPVDAETPADNNTENNEAVPEAAPQEEALTLDEDPDLPVDRNGENTFCKNCDLKQTNGALNYTYHFEIPKGRNGIEPEINLIYSQLNRAADSIAGYGWELNTGGYVEREKRKGIEDIYSLNEFKLNFNGGTSTLLPVDLTDSTHGQYGAKAEEAFFKYEFLDNDSWLVTDTRGTKYYYGQSAGSRQNPTGYTYKWMLDKIEDTNGNFVSFSYHKDSGQIYPEEIEYTKHGEEEGKYLIRFEPFATGTSTPASNYSYSSGAEVNTRYRVDKITVTVIGENNDDPIKEYRLDYGTKSLISYDFLTSIQEFGWNGSAFESLPEIEFEYNDGGTGWDYYNNNSGYPFDINPVSPYIWGDLNADSYDDFSRLESGKTVVKSYLNNTGAWWNYTDNWQMPYEEGLYDHRNNLLLDINNDGYADFLSFNNYSLLDVYINNKTDDWGGRQSSSGWYAYYPPNGAVIYADANADGLADTFSYSGCGGSTCYIAPIYNNGTTGWSASGQGPEIYESNNTRLLDYNNDGLSDIIEWNSQRAGKLITQIGSEDWREESFFVPGQNTDYLGNTLPFMFADINGDGLTDLITQGATSTEKFYFSNGKNGWSEAGDDWSEGLNPIYPVHHWFVDQNNDGFTDIISSSRELYRNNTAQPPYTLKKVKNNTGGEVDISYKNAKSYDNNSKMKSDMFVVEKISYYDREEKKEENTYSYEGGAHLREEDDPFSWEFRGFNEIKTADREGNYTLEFFHQGNETASSTGEFEDHISKKGKIYRQESYDANGNLYSLRINKYDKTDLGDGRFFPKLVSALTIDYDGNESYRAKASAFQYDSFGNITNKIDYGEVNSITGSGGFADTGTDLASTTISYIASTTPNIVGLPSRELLENQSGNKVRETKYYYDSLAFGSVSRGNLTKEERWKTGTSYVDIEKTYNSYGLITEEKDPRDKAASFTYDSSNLMVATSTNPLSQSTGYYYDYSSGKPIKTIDPNGRAFEIVLDAFDRVIEEKQPDIDTPSTLVLKSSYEYDDTGLPRMIKKTDYLTASSSVESYTYLDGFGRKIQERKKSEEENIYSVKDYAYNSRGLLDKETLPYFISGASSTPMTATSTLHILYSY